MKVLSVI